MPHAMAGRRPRPAANQPPRARGLRLTPRHTAIASGPLGPRARPAAEAMRCSQLWPRPRRSLAVPGDHLLHDVHTPASTARRAWVAEMAEEPLALEPGNRRVEWETNTWSLSAEDEDGRRLSAAEVVTAFEQTAACIRERIRELGFSEWPRSMCGMTGRPGSSGARPAPFLRTSCRPTALRGCRPSWSGRRGVSGRQHAGRCRLVEPGRRGRPLGASHDGV